jgi:chromosome partitioning protein
MPAMHVVAFCSHERGSGKTTLSRHLGAQAELAGAGPVALIDADPQGGLAAWRNARRGDNPVCTAPDLGGLPTVVARLRQERFALVLIDTPNAPSTAMERVMGIADLVVAPTRPSRYDPPALAAIVDMVERARCGIVFVLNGADPRARSTVDVAVALAQYGTVAPTFVRHRAEFADAMAEGGTVQERAPGGRAAREIELLWDCLASQLAKQARRRLVIQPIGMAFGRRAKPSGAMP